MTLRTIESEFSDLLKKEVNENFPYDLTMDGPLLIKHHPKVLWAQLLYERNPGQEAPKLEIPGWNYDCFISLEAAERKFPEIKMKFRGDPWAVGKFLSSQIGMAIIDFRPLGVAVVSRSPLQYEPGHELHHHLVAPWLNYALSPELWGNVGKWTRFHERLLTLFNSKNLFFGEAVPGHYPLKSVASKLYDSGFHGTNLDKTYLLVLPWTFSLSALKKLEEVVKQEF